MLSTNWRVLLTSLLVPALLAGCNGARQVYQETRADEPSGDTVVRAKADTDEKKKDDPDADKEGFRFPDDKGGQLLAKLLPPSVDGAALSVRDPQPRPKYAASSLEAPTMPLPPALSGIPQVSLEPKRPVLRPSLVLDEMVGGGEVVSLPAAQSFATGDKSREAGVDVNQPPPLPLLSQPVPDRASLDDPTGEASITAAVAMIVPLRAVTVPFQRQSIPDPFENYNPVRVSDPLAEDSEPPLGPIRNPKP